MCVSKHVLKFDCRGIGSNSGFSLDLVLQLLRNKALNPEREAWIGASRGTPCNNLAVLILNDQGMILNDQEMILRGWSSTIGGWSSVVITITSVPPLALLPTPAWLSDYNPNTGPTVRNTSLSDTTCWHDLYGDSLIGVICARVSLIASNWGIAWKRSHLVLNSPMMLSLSILQITF